MDLELEFLISSKSSLAEWPTSLPGKSSFQPLDLDVNLLLPAPSVSTTRGQPGDVPMHSSVVDVLSEQLVLGEVNLQNDGLLCHSYQILLCGFFSLAWLTAEPAGHLRGGWDSLLQEDLEASPSIPGIPTEIENISQFVCLFTYWASVCTVASCFTTHTQRGNKEGVQEEYLEGVDQKRFLPLYLFSLFVYILGWCLHCFT